MVIGFEAVEGGIEHFPARHHNDIAGGAEFLTPEYLAGQALGAVAVNRGANLSRGRHSKTRHGAASRQHKHRHEPAVHPRAFTVDAIELRAAADTLGGP